MIRLRTLPQATPQHLADGVTGQLCYGKQTMRHLVGGQSLLRPGEHLSGRRVIPGTQHDEGNDLLFLVRFLNPDDRGVCTARTPRSTGWRPEVTWTSVRRSAT
jgi:hypothetical protein